MLYKAVWSISLVGLAIASSFASADILYDCSLVANENFNPLSSINVTTVNPLSSDDLEGALADLKSYCCQIGSIVNECEGPTQNTSNAESPYIFDHLVSRWFFKLDDQLGDSKDSKGDEWATKLKEREDDGKWNAPVSLQNTFLQVRDPAGRYKARINNNTCQIENYGDLDLATRYTAVCRQAACVTSKFFVTTSDLDSRYNLAWCEDLAKRRIEDEMTYIQTLMVRKSNTLMTNVWETYTKSYLLETRRATLIDKFSRINETFSSVNGKVQEGTRMCSN